jgi:hypothetical protein
MIFLAFFVSFSLHFIPIFASNAVRVAAQNGRKVCTVLANGQSKDDVPNILKAFDECGTGGTIIFPEEQSYWIAQRFNPVVKDISIEWRGLWTVRKLVGPCCVLLCTNYNSSAIT